MLTAIPAVTIAAATAMTHDGTVALSRRGAFESGVESEIGIRSDRDRPS
jgi:hypothetical protein